MTFKEIDNLLEQSSKLSPEFRIAKIYVSKQDMQKLNTDEATGNFNEVNTFVYHSDHGQVEIEVNNGN